MNQLRRLVVLVGICSSLQCISPGQSSVPPQTDSEQEIQQRSVSSTFRVRVNQVLVNVVVRDRDGKAIANLPREDFELYDNGVRQTISSFRTESRVPTSSTVSRTAPNIRAENAVIMPERYIAYLFDDLHSSASEITRTRDAAIKQIEQQIKQSDRVAVFTTSGRNNLDFTDDHSSIRNALMKLTSASEFAETCPYMTYYLANKIVEERDDHLLKLLELQCRQCSGARDKEAETMVLTSAQLVLNRGDHQSQLAFATIRDGINRLASVPGKRILVLASPGFFLTKDFYFSLSDAVDDATRAGVVVNALDIRGLWIEPQYDASMTIPGSAYNNGVSLVQYADNSAKAQQELLASLAYGTGGTIFQNNNDLGVGFKQAAESPEFSYVLAFAPTALKNDGKLHSLEVKLRKDDTSYRRYRVISRTGYFAPKKEPDPKEAAREEIEAALFSTDELHEIPITTHTEFFKKTSDEASVAVLTHVDLKGVAFQKVDGRHRDTISVVSGIFDRNGRFLQGVQKDVEFRLREETLAANLGRGIVVRADFPVKTGGYFVRVVVRDPQGQTLAATSSSLEIP